MVFCVRRPAEAIKHGSLVNITGNLQVLLLIPIPVPGGTGMGILAGSHFQTLGTPVPVAGNPQVYPN
jgi:hypothetical protein